MALILFFFIAAEANVIGIDLGSEFIKVSLIKPGKKFVIVENEESKRLTPSSFSISEEGRHFGLKSLNDYIKTPDSSIKLIKQFLGRSINESFVSQKLKELYETKEVIESPYGGISYKINNQTYEIEEIMGMVFEYIQDLSNKFAGTVIKDCAITIPSSFSRSQKLSLLASAEISGLNVIGLIYENTAAALYYALDRTDTDTDHTIVIYNIGNSYIQVSVASI
jgi:Molecular chaperone